MSRSSRRKANSSRQRYDDMEEETPSRSRRAPSSNYVMSAGQGKGALSRIREPHPHDILCGRGGSINNHAGNKMFRDWVHERKNDYNLAPNKSEKARVSREVIELVQSQEPPGRFLTRDPEAPSMGPNWWIEIDDTKAMAKTSQALREGAPAIRAQHKDELAERKQRGTTRRGSKRSASVMEEEPEPVSEPAVWPQPAPASYPEPSEEEIMPPPPVVAMSNEMAIEALRTAAEAAKHGLGAPMDDKNSAELVSRAMVHHDHHPSKKAKITDRATEEESVTPPLMPMSGEDPKPNISLAGIAKTDAMKRTHSLALSDINDGDLEFVNPFENESSDHPIGFLHRFSGDSNHSVGHMSFSSLPKLSNTDLSRHRSNGTNNGSLFRKNISSRSVSVDGNEGTTSDSPAPMNCFCECGNPLLDGGVCPCGALADHLVWRDDHIEDDDWLHISGFMDQIVPVSP